MKNKPPKKPITGEAPGKPVGPTPPIPSSRTHLLTGARASVLRLAVERREATKAQADALCDEEIRRVLDEGSEEKTVGPFRWTAKGEGDVVTLTATQDVAKEGGA